MFSGKCLSSNEQFEREETVTYKDSETGEDIEQKITGKVVKWKLLGEEKAQSYDLTETIEGKKLVSDAGAIPGALTKNAQNSDYGKFREDVLKVGVTNTYGVQQTAALQNLGVGTAYNGTPYVNLYAVWDMGPVIEAYDCYYTLEKHRSFNFVEEDALL